LSFNDDSPRPDAELIVAALSGDGEAFGLIVKRHRPPLLEMARRILGQREEAEDVLQEVFMQVHIHLNSFRRESKLSTWLYTIALNRVRNHLRQRGNRRMISLDGGPEEEAPPMELPEKGPALEEIVAQSRDAERLRQAVEGLPKDFRSIFILHYYQHLPLEEVSRRLAKPLGTVKVYLHRARKRLHADLTTAPAGAPASKLSEAVLN
jgi:RNA polymerase sigma-70 factor (ECF subfamily)